MDIIKKNSYKEHTATHNIELQRTYNYTDINSQNMKLHETYSYKKQKLHTKYSYKEHINAQSKQLHRT
jgi:hypothetical protein